MFETRSLPLIQHTLLNITKCAYRRKRTDVDTYNKQTNINLSIIGVIFNEIFFLFTVLRSVSSKPVISAINRSILCYSVTFTSRVRGHRKVNSTFLLNLIRKMNQSAPNVRTSSSKDYVVSFVINLYIIIAKKINRLNLNFHEKFPELFL